MFSWKTQEFANNFRKHIQTTEGWKILLLYSRKKKLTTFSKEFNTVSVSPTTSLCGNAPHPENQLDTIAGGKHAICSEKANDALSL